MTSFREDFERGLVRVAFSQWSTLILAGTFTLCLFTFGIDPDSTTFWVILGVALAPFLLWDLAFWVYYRARGQSYSDVRRDVAGKTLAEMRRRREGQVGQ